MKLHLSFKVNHRDHNDCLILTVIGGMLKDISENVTLVQLMNSLGNLNRDISVVGYCIFGSNYKKSFFLNRVSLDMICSPSVGDEKAAKFEPVFAAVR